MKIRVVAIADSWILERIARECIRGLGSLDSADIADRPDYTSDINYFVNYYQLAPYINDERLKEKTRIMAYFTHKEPAYRKAWIDAESVCDAAVYMCSMFRPDVPLAYKLYPTGIEHKISTSVLRIGVNSRAYTSGRKGDTALHTIDSGLVSSGCDIEWNFYKGSGWEDQRWDGAVCTCERPDYSNYNEAARFYQNIDVLLSMAKYEGGPVPVHEAVKFGLPVVCTRTGAVEVWGELVQTVRNAYEAIIDLKRLAQKKQKRYDLCKKDWNWFAQQHQKVFEEVGKIKKKSC